MVMGKEQHQKKKKRRIGAWGLFPWFSLGLMLIHIFSWYILWPSRVSTGDGNRLIYGNNGEYIKAPFILNFIAQWGMIKWR